MSFLGTLDQGDSDMLEQINYEPGHARWDDALSNVEVCRFVPPAGRGVKINTVEFQQKGGGSSASANIDIFDATASTELVSVDLGSSDRTGYTAGDGNTVLVRISNSTGGTIDAMPIVRGELV